MVHVNVRDELDAPLDAVWRLIRDFGDLSAWAPTGKVLGVEGSGVGAVRRVESEAGLFVERCEAHDDDAHRFSYAVLESPFPLEKYVAVVQLRALGSERCAIEWSSDFETPPELAETMQTSVESVYRDGFIASFKQALERLGERS